MRKNLIKRMIDKDINRKDMANLLGLSEKTMKKKIDGEADFKWSEILLLKHTYFKEDTFEELFQNIESGA